MRKKGYRPEASAGQSGILPERLRPPAPTTKVPIIQPNLCTGVAMAASYARKVPASAAARNVAGVRRAVGAGLVNAAELCHVGSDNSEFRNHAYLGPE